MAAYIKKYNPKRSADWNYGGSKWKLSRSKIDLFIECPRCFYLDNKLGIKRPSMPSFNLNIAVDTLFKKEFDQYRETQTPHPIMKDNGVEAVPFAHKDMDIWRNNFEGITHLHKETGLMVSGAIDDVWETKANELIVVDYKATAKEGKIESLSDSPWEAQYQRQIGVYQWLFKQNDFTVSPTGYFVYANGDDGKSDFNNVLSFETTLVPCTGQLDWIPETLTDIKACLESDMYPTIGEYCEHCPYRAACGNALQIIHKAQQ